jgi:hypothetical protein
VPNENGGRLALGERELSRAVTETLGRGTAGEPAVVWSWQGSEILLHLDSVEVHLDPGALRVRLDCETAQTGRVPHEVRLALPVPAEPPTVTAAVDAVPGGDPRLAARWGPPLEDAVWTALLDLVGTDAAGVAADRGVLVVHRAATRPVEQD